jgi:hypothetical protein
MNFNHHNERFTGHSRRETDNLEIMDRREMESSLLITVYLLLYVIQILY